MLSSLYNLGIAVGSLLDGQRRSCLPEIPSSQSPAIWVHAVSLGETKAVAPIISLLREERPDLAWFVSTITETGLEEAKKCYPFATQFCLPYDYSWKMRALCHAIRPSLLLLAETDFWYHLLREVRGVGAKIALVNGKLSSASYQRWRRVPFLARQLFSHLDLACVQELQYKEFMQELGVGRVEVTGNVKFDAPCDAATPGELEALRSALGIAKGEFVVVAGSTHDPEEKLLLQQVPPNVKLLLVPRHPERFLEAKRLVRGISHALVVDEMGILAKLYQIADLAIVCGTYKKSIGGHNLIEPMLYGTPTLFGPYTQSQGEMGPQAVAARAAYQLPIEELGGAISRLAMHPEECEKLAERGRAFVEQQRGVANRTATALAALLAET